MPSLLEKVAKGVGSVAGVDISFSDGIANVNLTDSQVLAAQSVVRSILKTANSGKTTLNVKRSWEIVGIPVLETYGIPIGLGIALLVGGSIGLGYYMRGRK